MLERELKKAAIDTRIASGDALLHATFAARVLARLRAVAPELVAAAEEEVALGLD